MILAVDAAVRPGVDRRDENESPAGKRKSDLISPSSRGAAAEQQQQQRRSPLSEVNAPAASPPDDDAVGAAPAKQAKPPRSTPPTVPGRTTVPPPSASRFRDSANKFKPRSGGSQEEVQATNEERASVVQLSRWLTDSAKKNKKRADPRVGVVAAPSPVRFSAKPRIKKADVQATDTKAASVKTLSSWMDGDPFEQKRLRTIRTGRSVIAKSRAFEQENPSSANVRKECEIREGSVGARSAWLSGAFRTEREECGPPPPSPSTAPRPYQCKVKTAAPAKELRSVKDKKEWLSNAFKRGDGAPAGQPQQGQAQGQGHQKGEAQGQGQVQGLGPGVAPPGPTIREAQSFDVGAIRGQAGAGTNAVPDIRTCASADGGRGGGAATTTIRPAKSFDGSNEDPAGRSRGDPAGASGNETSDGGEEEEDEGRDGAGPEGKPTTVRDRQAWLSGAFKRPGGGTTAPAAAPDDATTPKAATGGGGGEDEGAPAVAPTAGGGRASDAAPAARGAPRLAVDGTRSDERRVAAPVDVDARRSEETSRGVREATGGRPEVAQRSLSGNPLDERKVVVVDLAARRARETAGVVRGAVRGAEEDRRGDDDDEGGTDATTSSVADRARWLRGAFRK